MRLYLKFANQVSIVIVIPAVIVARSRDFAASENSNYKLTYSITAPSNCYLRIKIREDQRYPTLSITYIPAHRFYGNSDMYSFYNDVLKHNS